MSAAEWLFSLAAIILIDLVLAGDNAVVIALAARNLPKHLQKPAVLWGTAGAIVVRVALVLVVSQLLKIPGLAAGGAALLFWVAYRLSSADSHPQVKGASSFAGAIASIVIADTVMGLDNILAIAAAARGDVLLIAIGLAISIPIMIWGSLWLLRWMEKHPWIVHLGGAVLFFVAARMLLDDIWVEEKTGLQDGDFIKWIIVAVITAAGTAAGAIGASVNKKKRAAD
jgi:YjbE family integral membrane protein